MRFLCCVGVDANVHPIREVQPRALQHTAPAKNVKPEIATPAPNRKAARTPAPRPPAPQNRSKINKKSSEVDNVIYAENMQLPSEISAVSLQAAAKEIVKVILSRAALQIQINQATSFSHTSAKTK